MRRLWSSRRLDEKDRQSQRRHQFRDFGDDIGRADWLDRARARPHRNADGPRDNVHADEKNDSDEAGCVYQPPDPDHIAWKVAWIDRIGEQRKPEDQHRQRGDGEEDPVSPPLLEMLRGDQSVHAARNQNARSDEPFRAAPVAKPIVRQSQVADRSARRLARRRCCCRGHGYIDLLVGVSSRYTGCNTQETRT